MSDDDSETDQSPNSAARGSTPPLPPLRALPSTGTLLALDHGLKRIGVAVTDRAQSLAMPVVNWVRRSQVEDVRQLKRILSDYEPVGVVIGLPVLASGDASRQVAVVTKFGQWVAELSRLPVTYWDERHTSTQAGLMLMAADISERHRDDRVDSLAAQLILQSYLRASDRLALPGPLSDG